MATTREFKLPDLGEGLTEGEVARWLVSEGDEVAEDQPLVEIQTDKTTVEIPSPAAGKVAQILVEEGKVVPVGTVLVVIGEDGANRSPRSNRGRNRPLRPRPGDRPPDRSRRDGCGQHRSSGGLARSLASTWQHSPGPGRKGA